MFATFPFKIDDIIIITENLEEMENMLGELATASRETGLKMNNVHAMNMQKTNMTNPHVITKNVTINGCHIEEVDDYIYLGQQFSLKEKGQEHKKKRAESSLVDAVWQTP